MTGRVFLKTMSSLLILSEIFLVYTPVFGSGGKKTGFPVPERLILTVRETAGVARVNEVISSGVPLPRSLGLKNVAALAITDSDGQLVPAEFQVLARWNAGRNETDAPLEWLLISFPVSVAAHGVSTFRLVTDGSAGANPLPATPIMLTQTGNRVTVDTGSARFIFGGDSGALFDEISLGDGTLLVSGGSLTVDRESLTYYHPTTREVRISSAGGLRAVVEVRGEYDLPAVGGGKLGSYRQYVFTALSPTAIVRQAVIWEGDLCGQDGWDLTCENNGQAVVNGLLLTRVRDSLDLSPAQMESVAVLGGFDQDPIQGPVTAGQTAWIRQQMRSGRTQPLSFDAVAPGSPGASGQKADGGLLAVRGDKGAVVAALNHMHRYEPQAIRLLEDGRLAVDLADDHVWLGQRQGLFATLAIGVLPPDPGRADLDRLVWGPLNRPLRAWPEARWFASSRAVDEFPFAGLSADLADYDVVQASLLAETLAKIDEKGLAGLMTFGVYPRYWGTDLLGDELDCGEDDPTPGSTWDDAYWCGTWTDYHNTIAAALVWAMRTGQVELLDEIAFPGAWRTLHTQIIQCSPDSDYFYCGQAPAGYGGYRADFNGSHAYFDNLMLYYWLTGDGAVVDILKRGASSMRNFLCSRRPDEACRPDDPPTDFWAQLTGRVASQWFAVFRFVGLAGDEAGYLDDFKSGLARAVTQHYVEAKQNGTAYGFLLDGATPVNGPGTYTTDQLWMVSLYDMNNLYRLGVETDNAPLGNPAVSPNRVLAAWARTLKDFGATTVGNGTAAGDWPNALDFTWTGDRIGGSLGQVAANTTGDDPYLYDTGKAALTAVLMRAADMTGNRDLSDMGRDLTLFSLNSIKNNPAPLGKIPGEYFARLPAAVAIIEHPSLTRALPWLILLMQGGDPQPSPP